MSAEAVTGFFSATSLEYSGGSLCGAVVILILRFAEIVLTAVSLSTRYWRVACR